MALYSFNGLKIHNGLMQPQWLGISGVLRSQLARNGFVHFVAYIRFSRYIQIESKKIYTVEYK